MVMKASQRHGSGDLPLLRHGVSHEIEKAWVRWHKIIDLISEECEWYRRHSFGIIGGKRYAYH